MIPFLWYYPSRVGIKIRRDDMPHARLRNSALPAERDHTGGHPMRRRQLAASSVLVLGAGWRLYGLNLQSAWADEITTLVITDPALTFGQFWQLVIADVHPPLYYLLLRFWSAAFGQSDVAARIPSAPGEHLLASIGATEDAGLYQFLERSAFGSRLRTGSCDEVPPAFSSFGLFKGAGRFRLANASNPYFSPSPALG